VYFYLTYYKMFDLYNRDILLKITSVQKVSKNNGSRDDQVGDQLSASVTKFEMELKFFN